MLGAEVSQNPCVAVVCTVDLLRKDSEIKQATGCTEGEKAGICVFKNDSEHMKGTMIRRDSEDRL